MKTLPMLPYLQNITKHYHEMKGDLKYHDDYPEWLNQFGFKVPVDTRGLEFPDISDQELLIFILRWG